MKPGPSGPGVVTTFSEFLAPNVHLRTVDDGRLALIVLEPAEGGLRTAWTAFVTAGWRDVNWGRGYVIHDLTPDVTEHAVTMALRTILRAAERSPDAKETGAAAEAEALARPWPEDAKTTLHGIRNLPEGRRLAEVCGAATMTVRADGADMNLLRMMDAKCGPERIEALFAEWPFLLFHFMDFIGTENEALRMPLLERALAVPMAEGLDAVAAALAEIDASRSPPAARPARVAGLRRLLKRMRGVVVEHRPGFGRVVSLAAAVPPEWLPSDAEAYEAFAKAAKLMVDIAETASGGLDPTVLAASSKGRWPEFVARMERSGNARDVRDMVQAFVNQVAAPAIMHALAFPEGGGAPDHELRQALQRVGNLTGNAMGERAACWKLLFGGKSAPAIIETSREWHRDQEAMAMVIGLSDTMAWPAPFGRIEVSEGVALVAITTQPGLRLEGAGLRHCVGGYSDGCISRRHVIASLRRTDPGGFEVSSSTVQLSAWTPGTEWMPRIEQHRGLLNAAPSAEDVEAVSRAIDLWLQGDRIAAGEKTDADAADVHHLDDARRIAFHIDLDDMPPVVVDPPYGGGFDRAMPGGGPLMEIHRQIMLREGGGAVPERHRRLGQWENFAGWIGVGQDAQARHQDRQDRTVRNAGYDWMDRAALDNAFAQWARFIPGEAGAVGPEWFAERLDGFATPTVREEARRRREELMAMRELNARTEADEQAAAAACRAALAREKAVEDAERARRMQSRGRTMFYLRIAAAELALLLLLGGGGLTAGKAAVLTLSFALVFAATFLVVERLAPKKAAQGGEAVAETAA